MTADYRQFEKQVEYFRDRAGVLVLDAPGHNESRPFALDFTLMDEAECLHNIILAENVSNPVLVGQSIGENVIN